MTKLKHFESEIIKQKSKKKNPFSKDQPEIEIHRLETVSYNGLCKQCKEYERKNGSSRCERCSNANQVNKLTNARLNKKIADQIKKKWQSS